MSNYLYNGIELPALPEWDKETYPYAIMVFQEVSTPDRHVVYFGSKLNVTDTTIFMPANTYLQSSRDEGAEDWTRPKNDFGLADIDHHFYFDSTGKVEKVVWSNTDLRYADGSLYLAASDPVPVGKLSWQKHDAYKPNTKWDGQTFYKAIGNKWVKHDAVSPSLIDVDPDVPTEVVIEWDGDITGKVTAQSGTFNLVKVSDLTPTYNDLVGAVITAGTETITITEEMLGVSPQDVFVSLLDGMFVSVYDFGIDLPFTELGFYANIEVGAFKLTYTPKA